MILRWWLFESKHCPFFWWGNLYSALPLFLRFIDWKMTCFDNFTRIFCFFDCFFGYTDSRNYSHWLRFNLQSSLFFIASSFIVGSPIDDATIAFGSRFLFLYRAFFSPKSTLNHMVKLVVSLWQKFNMLNKFIILMMKLV